MATSAISNSIPAYQPLNQPDFRQEFRQLVSSIKSGDLSGAQQAYAAISQMQGSGQAPSSANANSPIAQALNQIGQSLQNGDIAGAQQALATLSQQAKGAHHGHHHHGAPAEQPADADTSGARTGGIDIVA